jgi:signal transduction histidine kinase
MNTEAIDTLRRIALFDGLTDAQLAELLAVGEVLEFHRDQVLFREARPATFWWVLLDGTIELVRHVGREDTVLGALNTPGQWAGGFQAWDPHGMYLGSGRCAGTGHVLRVPADGLRDLANNWFPFGMHLIKGLTQTVRNIESTTRQRESLVALGTLAAGLAHEINNPASAASRAVDALQESTEGVLSALGRLADQSISAAQFAALDQLRRNASAPAVGMSPRAIAAREEELSDWLVDHDVDQDWLIAPALAAAGLDVQWCDRVAAVLDRGALAPGLEWIAHALSVSTLLAEVKESTGRISNLVGVVKSYSQMDRASLQPTDVRDGLESTLIMLGPKLGSGIAIDRAYGVDVPAIDAMAGELNQVWTNLIDNAVDAMHGSGTLRVSTRVESDAVVVEIGDTGTGMTPDVRAHAFDPFFTTKEVGKGTGLGLDISRRIVVERHGGEISIDSQPGETVLRVRLPLRSARSR